MTLVLNKATTVLPVDDAERARHFYADTLGLPHRGVADDGSELFGSEGGPMLQLMPVKDGMHSEHTTLSFEVSGRQERLTGVAGSAKPISGALT